MILCDTNVLIDYWNNPKELLNLNISKDKHSICGIVKSVLFDGGFCVVVGVCPTYE